MTTALAGLRDRLPRVKRWVGAAIAIGVVLASYYGYQGWLYWNSTGKVESSTSRINELSQAIQAEIPDQAVLEEDVEREERLVEEWAGIFSVDSIEVTVTDDSGTVTATTSVPRLNIAGDVAQVLDLDISPGVEYGIRVEHIGGARHYQLSSDNPQLEIGHLELRYLDNSPQEWGVKAAADQPVVLQIATDDAPTNEGAPQADFVELTVFDQDSGAVVFGPTSTVLSLDSHHEFTIPGTSTSRDLRIRVTPNGNLRMKRIDGRGDPLLYLLPCAGTAGGAEEAPKCPPLLSIFEADDAHSWTMRWASSTPPELGQAQLKVVVPALELAKGLAESTADQLLASIYELAEGSGVQIGSATVDEQATEVAELVQYQTESLSLSLAAQSHKDVYRFLQALHRKMRFLEVQDFSMAGFSGEPTAKVRLHFLLLPEPVVPEEKE